MGDCSEISEGRPYWEIRQLTRPDGGPVQHVGRHLQNLATVTTIIRSRQSLRDRTDASKLIIHLNLSTVQHFLDLCEQFAIFFFQEHDTGYLAEVDIVLSKNP